MSPIYYVSDYHSFHELALKRSRGEYFNDVNEINEEIIRKHNDKVKDDDHVYILGDVIVCEEKDLQEKLNMTVERLIILNYVI